MATRSGSSSPFAVRPRALLFVTAVALLAGPHAAGAGGALPVVVDNGTVALGVDIFGSLNVSAAPSLPSTPEGFGPLIGDCPEQCCRRGMHLCSIRQLGKRAGAHRFACQQHLCSAPLVGALLDWLWLGVSLRPVQMLAGLAILAGVLNLQMNEDLNRADGSPNPGTGRPQ